MPSCSVKWCPNHTSTCSLKSKNGVSFHRFPKDEATCQKWVEAVRLERRDQWWTSSKASRVCSLHFKDSDISSTLCKVNVLAKNAVPICTMIWYDDNENNITYTPLNEIRNKDKTILKTYERKKTKVNVFKESQVIVSKTNIVVTPNITACVIPQANVLQELDNKLLQTQNTMEYLDSNSAAKIGFKTVNANINEVQKNILTECNKKAYTKTHKEKCCNSDILVKLNDNTRLVLEDLITDTDTTFNGIKDLNTKACENSKKVIMKELESNENKEPNQDITNVPNTDMFVEAINNGNVELNANISNSYVGKMLKTYMPKRKEKRNKKNIRDKHVKRNKSISATNMEKGLNTVKYKDVNITNVNIYPKDGFIKKLNNGVCFKNNIKTERNKQVSTFRNVKKYFFTRSNLFNRPRIREQDNPGGINPNMNASKDSNIIEIEEFITRQSKVTDTIFDETILELFDNSKSIVNVSDISYNDKCQESNENRCVESNKTLSPDNNMDAALDRDTNNMHVILDLDTNLYTELNTLVDSELCSEVNTGLNNEINTEVNTYKTGNNEIYTQFNENKMTKLNQLSIVNKNMTMEDRDNLISEYHYCLDTKIGKNIITQSNKSMYCNKNFTINAIILYNNGLQDLETSFINNIVNEKKAEEFTELKKLLSTMPKQVSFEELCTSITSKNLEVLDQNYNKEFNKNVDFKVNDNVTSLQNNINTDAIEKTESNVASKQLNSTLLEEFVTNISSELNNSEDMGFITKVITDKNTTSDVHFDKKNISDINIESTRVIEENMQELNTVLFSELYEDQLLNSKDINRECNNINTEMYTDKGLFLRKFNKDFENVQISDYQHKVVSEHMDVVDSIINRDEAEFDLSLLLSDTPIPDEYIQNVDNNSNNSLDGVEGSPYWIQLPTADIPKIIDDILDQDSPFFENLDLCKKVNKLNLGKEANKKDNDIKKPINDKYSASNFEQFEEQIIDDFCETGKQSTKKSIAQIKKQLVSEFDIYNESSPAQSNNICNVNKVGQSKKLTAENSYDLFDKQPDKQILKQYFQPINGQCDMVNLDKIVDEFSENSDKETQSDNKCINQCQKVNTVDQNANQIEDTFTNQYFGPHFEETEESHREQEDGLGIVIFNDEVLNFEDISELNKQKNNKQTNEQAYQSSVDELIRITLEESSPKSKIQNQGNLTSSFQEINKQLKKEIFEQCFDPECGNKCKNQKHNLNTEMPKKNVQRYKKQTIITPGESDIKKPKKRYDSLYKQQCNQSSINNLKKQSKDRCLDPNTKQNKKRLIEQCKSSHNEKWKTNYKKIAIDILPGQYLELRWPESEGTPSTWSQEECKRKHKELGWEKRKMRCTESNADNFSQEIMAECPECGYSTDDNDFMNYQSEVDLRITNALSLINKETLLSFHDENKQNNEDTRVTLESVYAMELAYITAVQALERKLKQKIAISEYRLKRVKTLSKINNRLIKANMTMEISDDNKM